MNWRIAAKVLPELLPSMTSHCRWWSITAKALPLGAPPHAPAPSTILQGSKVQRLLPIRVRLKKANETFELSNIVKPKLISTVCRWMVLKRNELFILTKFYNDHTSVNLVEFISTSKRNIMCIDRNVPPSQFRGKKKDRISKVHINTFLYFYSVGQLLWPRPNIIPAGDHNKIIFSHSNWFIFLWSNWIIFSSFTSRLYFYKYILRCLHRR